MSTFFGNALVGSFLFLYGFWWLCNVYHRFYRNRLLPKVYPYENVATFPSSRYPLVPVEGIIKLIAVGVGVIVESVGAGIKGAGHNFSQLQHLCILMFFGLSGLCDVLLFCNPSFISGMDHVAMALAFFMEAVFICYFDERSPLEKEVQAFLVYTAVGISLSICMELCFKHRVLPALSRSFFMLLQGTWLWQIAFLLYPPSGYKGNEERRIMLTMLFSAHVAGVFIFILLTGFFIHIKVRNYTRVNQFIQLESFSDEEVHYRSTSLVESDENNG